MTEQKEIWKDVIGWEEKYKVSNLGTVWNKIADREVAQVLTGIPQYKYVNMNLNGLFKLKRVHTLVAQAFIENPEGKRFVDHIDRDKMNNNLSNLRWVTRRENQRNLDSSIYFEDVHIKDFVLRYDNPEAAYQHIYASIRSGLDQDESIARYDEFLSHGFLRRKVVFEGEEFYLTDLCSSYNADYEVVSNRLSQGWNIWNALFNIPEKYNSSFEIMGNQGIGHWYKNNEMFESTHPTCLGVYKRLIAEGKTLDEILAYDGREYLRREVNGITGTIDELCKHYNKTRSSVDCRMMKGMTLEQALLSPPERIKKVTIDGISGTPKYWYEQFGLDYKKTKSKKDRLKCSFEEILEHFGVDLSNKAISYTD